MQNKIDATLSAANCDQILDLIQQINALLPFYEMRRLKLEFSFLNSTGILF
jgi:hypothetical protein